MCIQELQAKAIITYTNINELLFLWWAIQSLKSIDSPPELTLVCYAKIRGEEVLFCCWFGDAYMGKVTWSPVARVVGLCLMPSYHQNLSHCFVNHTHRHTFQSRCLSRHDIWNHIYIYIYIYICACLCVCVYVNITKTLLFFVKMPLIRYDNDILSSDKFTNCFFEMSGFPSVKFKSEWWCRFKQPSSHVSWWSKQWTPIVYMLFLNWNWPFDTCVIDISKSSHLLVAADIIIDQYQIN